MKLSELRRVGAAMEKDIADAMEKYGFTPATHGFFSARTNEHSGELRITIKLHDSNHKDANGETISPEVQRWNDYHQLYGLPKDALGKVVMINRRPYKIMGLRNSYRADKKVLLEKQDGSVRGCYADEETIKRALGISQRVRPTMADIMR